MIKFSITAVIAILSVLLSMHAAAANQVDDRPNLRSLKTMSVPTPAPTLPNGPINPPVVPVQPPVKPKPPTNAPVRPKPPVRITPAPTRAPKAPVMAPTRAPVDACRSCFAQCICLMGSPRTCACTCNDPACAFGTVPTNCGGTDCTQIQTLP
jgi:hypothetical protein